MRSRRPTGRRSRHRVVTVVVAALLLGAVGCAAVIISDGGPGVAVPAHVRLGRGWLPALLVLVTVGAELAAVRLRRGEHIEELTLLEAAVIVDALLLRPREAVAVALSGLVLAALLGRRSPLRAAFTLGAYATATAALVGTVQGLTPGAPSFGPEVVVAVLLGAAGFAAVNLALLALVLSADGGAPVRGTLRQDARLSAVMAVGSAAVGATTAAIAQAAPLLLPFTLLPAAALGYAYAAVGQEDDERLRARQLLALSHLLAASTDVEDLVTGFVATLREAFHAETAFVVLESAGREETVVLADSAAVHVRSAVPEERALLAVPPEGTVLRPEVPVASGTARALVTPLDAESRHLGVLCLTEPPRRAGRWSVSGLTGVPPHGCRLGPAEATLLGPLASGLAAALRGAEHLTLLQEETAKVRAVLEHSSDGIIVLDGDGTVTVWSPAAEAISGVGAEAALGRPLGAVVVATDADGGDIDALTEAWRLLSPSAPQTTVETGLRRPDGQHRWVRWAHAAVYDDQPGPRPPARDVVLLHDMTRERQVERLKSDFMATVSHELRSPLTPIKGYVDLLRRKDFTRERRIEVLDLVNDRVAHLTRLVEDLLLASRMTLPAATVQPLPADLGALVRRVAGDFAVEATRLHLELPRGPVPVLVDAVRVTQVVGNLVTNALKYSPAQSPVWVAVRSGDGLARVTVTDVGRGIPADQLDQVFEKFHRVEDPMHMTTGGTGLGLYIARQLAEAMAGRLEVESTYGSGSTFSFTLPLRVAGDDGTGMASGRFGRPPSGVARSSTAPPTARVGAEQA